MNGISKGLFLGSVAVGSGIALVLGIVIQVMRLTDGSADTILALSALSALPVLYSAIFLMVLNYKAWAAIQDGHARTTPGKAIGFLFIPFFDFYWLFQAIWGLAKDFNAYLQRRSIPSPHLPEGIFLAYCILCFVGWIPIVGLVVGMVNYIFALIMVSGLCDAINAAAKPPLTAPAAIG